MATIDPFVADAFSLRNMMDSVNRIPYTPGRVSALGIFDEKGVATTTVMVEQKDGLLSLVPTTPYGAAAIQGQRENRKMIPLAIPHIALEDTIIAAEIQNVRAFGTESQPQAIATVRDEHLTTMNRWMDATLEHHRIGALRGKVLDADGATVLTDIFATFGVTQVAEYAFNFVSGTVDPTAISNQIVRSIQDELQAASAMTGWHVHALCSSTFMDDFVTNQKVKDSYARYTDTQSVGIVGAFWRETHVRQPPFVWGGIAWEEYRDAGAGIGSFVPIDKAIFFPVGIPGLFPNYFAPADFQETVNTLGLPRYAKAAFDPEFNRWVKMHTQMNPLPICLRPRTLQIARRGA